MADHSRPLTTSAYANFVSELDARFDDLAVGLDPAFTTATNVPTNTIRYSGASTKWQRWNGSSWVDLAATYAISITGNAGTVTNGVVTTGSYSDPAWIASLAGAKISGNIAGNAGSATVLATARNINGVSFNGSANISVNLNNNVTFSNAGSGAASGVVFNGGSAITVSHNTIGAAPLNGAGATGTWGINITGSAASVNTSTTILSTARVGMRITSSSNDAMYEVVKPGVVGYGLVIQADNRIALAQTNGVGDWFKTLLSVDTNGNTTTAGNLNTIGDFTASGNVTAYSDERLKQNWRDLPVDFLERLAEVKMGIYDRKDTGETQAGVSAQSMKALLSPVVREGADGMLSVAYGNAALASCIALAREVRNLKAELTAMKG
jgi:hypothetical protein